MYLIPGRLGQCEDAVRKWFQMLWDANQPIIEYWYNKILPQNSFIDYKKIYFCGFGFIIKTGASAYDSFSYQESSYLRFFNGDSLSGSWGVSTFTALLAEASSSCRCLSVWVDALELVKAGLASSSSFIAAAEPTLKRFFWLSVGPILLCRVMARDVV